MPVPIVIALVLGAASHMLLAQTLSELKPGVPVERTIARDAVHTFSVALKAGEQRRVDVEQRGPDVVLTLVAPSGVKLREFDSPTGDQSVEELESITAAGTAGEGSADGP